MKKHQVPPYSCTSPCNNCPYRTDAPLRLWAREEFEKLLKTEAEPMGAIYNCHKNNGSTCIGWLIKQDEQYLPSIMLRISLTKHNITRDYLDKLTSPAPLFKDVKAMIRANFPSILRVKNKLNF